MLPRNLNNSQTALSSPNCTPEKKTADTGAIIMMKISKISDCAYRFSGASHRHTASRLTMSSCNHKSSETERTSREENF